MPDLFLTIPCEIGKLNRFEPILVFIKNDVTGAAVCRYECPHCHGRGPRRKPIAQHMGLFADKPATCRVLIAEDVRRRRKDALT